MQRKVARLLLLAALSVLALWPTAPSWALDFCPVQSCPFWIDICERGGNSWSLVTTGICLMDDNSINTKFRVVCTTTSGQWNVDCIDM
jgi:hypothetical protein